MPKRGAAAAITLGKIGANSPEAVTALTSKLKGTKDPMRVRIAAARGLALLGPAAKSAANDLREFGAGKSKTPDPVAVVWAAAALYRIGVNPEANLQVVSNALKSKLPADRAARSAAMEAVDLLGPAAESLLPEIMDVLKDGGANPAADKMSIRLKAVEAIGRMGISATKAVPQLRSLLKTTDPALKSATLEALGRIGTFAEPAAARLREIVRTEPAYAEQAQAALDKIELK